MPPVVAADSPSSRRQGEGNPPTLLTPRRLGADVLAGLLGPLAISPLIAIVDFAIINRNNGTGTPVLQGIKNGYRTLLTRPHHFARDWKWRRITATCWMVYAGTYVSGNLSRTLLEEYQVSAATRSYVQLGVVSAANIGLTVVKDVLMVKIAGQTRGVPMLSRGLFCVRDGLTMFAAFVVAERAADALMVYMGPTAVSRDSALFGMNMAIPAATQAVSTVVHLAALQHAKAPQKGLLELIPTIRSEYTVSTMSRVFRILPAVGGGKSISEWTHGKLLHSTSE